MHHKRHYGVKYVDEYLKVIYLCSQLYSVLPNHLVIKFH